MLVYMHIYCNAVSYKCSHNCVHLQCILYTVCNNYYVLINVSGSSAANSNVHNYSLLIFCSSSSGTNLHFRSIHRSQVPLNVLGWDFMPISFWEDRTLPIPTIALGSIPYVQWQHGVKHQLLPLSQFSLLLGIGQSADVYTRINFPYMSMQCASYRKAHTPLAGHSTVNKA